MSTDTITGITASRIDDLPAGMGGAVKLVRAGLGLRGFGAQVIDLPPDGRAPEHDETATGQEELYVVLRGSGAVVAGGERFAVDSERVVAVAPHVTRHLAAGPDGLRVLCVGGAPGCAYAPPAWTERP